MKNWMCSQCEERYAVKKDGQCWYCATNGGVVHYDRRKTKKDLTVQVELSYEAIQVAAKLAIPHHELVKRALDEFVKREYSMSSKASDQVNGWD